MSLIASLGQYVSNVMMKINLKQTGWNHSSADDDKGQVRLRRTLLGISSKRSIMILDADVTHPGSSSLIGCPSIATLVSSADFDGGKFLGSMRLQSSSKKEVISKEEMEAMAIERFTVWRNNQTHLADPPNILYYRDGVSTGQLTSSASPTFAPPCLYPTALHVTTPTVSASAVANTSKNAIEERHKNALALAVAALPPNRPSEGRRRARKTQQQVDSERQSKGRAETDIETLVQGQAQAYLDRVRTGGPESWAENVDRTMFWM
ncbi:hypothetical protein BDU57DRAFT_547529 [Ampelomyces quisqualis]|uniref:Piwi domain-containing protein n=1 Tax=Ampelomyces quisqualis TaxID=50730 RepID=A0A6A5QVA0_AMPQU|nr:hypothetical protein BDU57DRAFT_547529 [Ampelomyces quisqualis]